MKSYDPNNWYWIVGGSSTQVYSSASGTFVPVTDTTYQGWLARENIPTKIDTEEHLGEVLAAAGATAPVDANVQDSYKNSIASQIETVVFRILFNHENRIRVINNQQQITPVQFITAIKSLL